MVEVEPNISYRTGDSNIYAAFLVFEKGKKEWQPNTDEITILKILEDRLAYLALQDGYENTDLMNAQWHLENCITEFTKYLPVESINSTPFKIGDIVKLKSDGPEMTVCINTNTNLVQCRWFNGTVIHSDYFKPETLTHV